LSSGFSRFADQAKTDGRIIAEEALDPMNEAVEKLGHAFDRLVDTIKGAFTPALEAAAKIVTPILDALNTAAVGVKGFFKVGVEAGKLALGMTLPGADIGKQAKNLSDTAGNVGFQAIADLMDQEQTLRDTRTDKGAVSSADIAKRLGQANRLDELAGMLGQRQAVDGFARAGLFVTPGATHAQTVQQKNISLLQRIAENTRETAMAVEKNG